MNKDKYTHIVHPIPPFYDAASRILILGSFPSVKSRESGFFYGHPQNRFWRLIAQLFAEETVPVTVPQKQAFLARHHIAAWDVVHACDIIGSGDSTIRNVEVNDFSPILQTADIKAIYANGRKSYDLYMKYCAPATHREAMYMPSTSPANAACGMEKLAAAWGDIRRWV